EGGTAGKLPSLWLSVHGAGVFLRQSSWEVRCGAFPGNDLEIAILLGEPGLRPRSALRCGKGSGNPQPDDLSALPRTGALAGGLRGAVPSAGGRPVWGKPQPGVSTSPISSDPQTFARRCPGGLSGQPPGTGRGSPSP